MGGLHGAIVAGAATLALTLAACAGLRDPEAISDSGNGVVGASAPVPAAGETVAVGTVNADAADDPEIWADPADPSRAVIFGTDKQAGLYVYELDGRVRQFLPQSRLNNVDLRDGLRVDGRPQVLVGASDRDRKGVALFLLDPATLQTRPWDFLPVDLPLPYGFCMGRSPAGFWAVLNGEDGGVRQLEISERGGRAVAREVRRFAVGSQTEGCVVDDVTGALYIGEEGRGVWRYSIDPASGTQRTLFAAAPSAMLKPDVEGLTLLREGAATYLIASSQGDSTFAVWRVDGLRSDYVNRFSVIAAGGVDRVTGTDGVAALGGPVGRFGLGLVVVQDDRDDGPAAAPGARQNFKLVGWTAIKAALGL